MSKPSKVSVNDIRKIIKEKKSNICLAADVNSVKRLFEIIELLGDKICILKIHYDIIEDFCIDIENTISTLLMLKKKYNFLIWEDRKFADIGAIMIRQVKTHVSRWADLISVHSMMGEEGIKQLDFISVIVIGELSTKDCIINSEYMKKTESIINNNTHIVGVVCQHKMTKNKLNIVPGISFKNTEDGMGQKYTSISDQSKSFADIYVIGRSILNTENPKKTLEDFLTK